MARGTALNEGKVELTWTGATTRVGVNTFHPSIYSADDIDNHEAGEPVLLVIPSKPFAIDTTLGNKFLTRLDLSKRKNLEISSIELQVWQGEGSKKDWGAYLIPFALFVALMGMAYGVYSKVTGRMVR